MPVQQNAPFFEAELGEFMDVARAYGRGGSLKQIAADNPNISLTTLKKLFSGKPVLPKVFLVICAALEMRPLDFIEAKIRYSEAHLNEYLAKYTAHQLEEGIHKIDLTHFFSRRRDQKALFKTRKYRLHSYIEGMFSKAKLTPLQVAESRGPKAKKDMHSISYQTVTAIQRGQNSRPEKFNLLCRKLGIAQENLFTAKILYSEAYLEGYLLGEDLAVFKELDPINYPRTCALLIFSAREKCYLP